MEHWQEFFVRNRSVILFIYGQVFFILGLAITWQSRRHSRLALARSLGWLGAFGLTHGLHEWGGIFIPIQAEYLNRAWVETLVIIQVCLLAFSFACLFQFGVETLYRLQPGFRWLQAIPAGLLLVWVSAFLWTSQVSRWPPTQSIVLANVWARYLLAFPGAIVAALALRQHTRRQSGWRAFPHIARTFQIASLALALYALFGGLLAPRATFFPANVINAEAVTHLLGIPVELLGSIAGLVLVIAIVRGLEIFEVEVDQRLERMEQAQVLLAERERVSRELHDGAIQTVYTAGLLAESVRKKMADDNPLVPRLDAVIGALRSAIEDLRQFVAGLEPDAAGENLATGLRKLVEDPSLQSLIRVEPVIQCAEDDCLSPTRTAHVLAVVNEALSNVARHAHGRQAWVTAERHNGQLEVRIADDGRGFDRDDFMSGFGLRNMRDRARLLGGTLRVEPRSPRGTLVVLTIPWEDAS